MKSEIVTENPVEPKHNLRIVSATGEIVLGDDKQARNYDGWTGVVVYSPYGKYIGELRLWTTMEAMEKNSKPWSGTIKISG